MKKFQKNQMMGWVVLALMVMAGILTATTLAQSGGGFAIPWWTVDGGGGESSSNSYHLVGTIGQPEGGPLISSNTYTFSGGFWGNAVQQVIYSAFLPVVTDKRCQEEEDNDSAEQANGPLPSGAACIGLADDDKDFFRFTASTHGTITIELTNHTGSDTQLQLLYQDASHLVGYDAVPPYHIEYNGEAGLYYIFIYTIPPDSPAPYTLSVVYP
jgi:hypothetical protein